MKNEYYVAIDSNGEPYIEHAIFGRNSGGSNSRGSRQNVKYLEKIKDGARTRYFYTQDELQAYYNKGKNAAKNAANKASQSVKDAVGITARNKANAAFDNALAAQSKYLSAVKDKNGRYKGSAYQAEYAVSDAQKQKENLDRIKAEQTEYLKKHPIMSTKKAQEQMHQVKDAETAAINASRDAGRAQERASKDQKAMLETRQAMDRAIEEYSKTPLSVIDDDYRSRFFDNMAEKAKEKVDEAKDDLTSNASKAKNTIETFGKEIANGVKNMASDMSGVTTKNSLNEVKAEREEAIKKAEKAEQKAEKLMARADRDGRYNTLNEAVNASDAELEAIRALNNAKTADERVKFWTKLYGDTPLGKIENAKEKVESTAKSLKDQVKSLIPGAKVSGNKIVMPSGNEVIIPEQFIKEKTIPETFIEEQLIKEKKRTKK